jgi:hypothetical protein
MQESQQFSAVQPVCYGNLAHENLSSAEQFSVHNEHDTEPV